MRNGQDVGTYINSPRWPRSAIDYFLHRLYGDLLMRHRAPARLLGPRTRAGGVALAPSGSCTARSTEQSGPYLYSQLLHRPADASGLATWLPFLEAGHSLDDVRAGILSSQEYFAHAGSSAGFVSSLYEDILGRQADPVGLFAWQTVLQLGLSRDQVVGLFQHSHEAAVHQVMLDYQKYLNRPAELDGLLFFAGAIEAGSDAQDVGAALAGSPEYFKGPGASSPY